MHVRVSVPLAFLVLCAGCFNPDDDPSAMATDTEGSTGVASTETSPTGSPTSTTTGTTVDSLTSTTEDPTGITATDTDSGSTTTGSESGDVSSSTGDPLPIECGDGVPAPGEVCFDDAAVLNAGDIGYSPRVGEVNGDGNVDLLYLYGDQIVVRLGGGDGTFGPELADETVFCDQMELADVDSDDVLDHVCTSNFDTTLSVSLGNGAGSFSLQATPTTVGASPVNLAAGALNGDDNADVVTIHGTESGLIRALVSQGNGLFMISDTVSTGGLPGADVALGDFTGDGFNDIVFTVVSGNEQVRIAVNDGTGEFGQSLTVSTTTDGAFGVAAGDFNDDGDDDVAVANGDEILTLVATGTASFESAVSLETPDGALAVRTDVVDVTNDDIPDVIAVYSNQAIVSIFPSNGDGTFGDRVDINVGAPSDSLSSGDVNDDGIPDIVVGSTSDELITVLVSTP